MKRVLFVLALTALLVMAAHSMALGAIHHYTDEISGGNLDAAATDTWFDLKKEAPKFLAGGYLESNYNYIGAMYFLGDQTFVQALFSGGDSIIEGSYLFKNNLFAGLSFETNGGNEFSYTTLGYRFALNGDNYIAASLDYLLSDFSGQDGVSGYDLDAKFYGEKWKVFGQIYIAEYQSGPFDGALITDFGANYGVSDTFVLGFVFFNIQVDGVVSSEITEFGVGFTWTPERWIVDALFESYEASGMVMLMTETESDFSIMYQASDKLYLGIENWRNDLDTRFAVKARYSFVKGELKAAYYLGTDIFDSGLGIAYEMKL
jgi:hypothetical protein